MNIEHHARVAASKDAPNHIGPHPSEPDHAQLHVFLDSCREIALGGPGATVLI